MGLGIKPIRIKQWSDLEKFVFRDRWPELNRHRTKRIFRGVTDSAFSLTTTLQRVGGSSRELEPKLLRQFKKYAHQDVINCRTDWHWLTLAQHHGLPTRFLDWTNSPFVGLHFATADWPNSGTDGALWALDFISLQQWLPASLRNSLDKLHVKVFTTDELADAAASPQVLEDLSKREFMVVFEPPSLDGRIVNQYAALTAMSRAGSDQEKWLLSRKQTVCEKLIIPCHLKAKIRERLDMMNITERVLYPGLDGLTMWLKRYYGPKWPPSNQVQPIYKGKYLHFFRAPNGWEYVERPKAQAGIAIVAVTSEGRLILIEQYRAAHKKTVIELPAGLIEPGQDANKAVRAELRQETGYTCAKAIPICKGALSPGLVNETNIMYCVQGLRRADSSKDDEAEGGIVRHGQTRGNPGEQERIQTWEVPVDDVPRWLEKRRGSGLVIDLRIYAGLQFVRGQATVKRFQERSAG